MKLQFKFVFQITKTHLGLLWIIWVHRNSLGLTRVARNLSAMLIKPTGALHENGVIRYHWEHSGSSGLYLDHLGSLRLIGVHPLMIMDQPASRPACLQRVPGLIVAFRQSLRLFWTNYDSSGLIMLTRNSLWLGEDLWVLVSLGQYYWCLIKPWFPGVESPW